MFQDTVKIFNTGEIVKNEFYVVSTPNKWSQDSFDKEIKIAHFINFYKKIYEACSNFILPNFLDLSIPKALFQTELDLEIFRQENFLEYPSRISSLFVFSNLKDAKEYREHINLKNANILRVYATDPNYKITKHNMEYITVLRVLYGSIFYEKLISEDKLIEKYWLGKADIFDYRKFNLPQGIIYPKFEYLIEGTYATTMLLEDQN